MKKHFILVFLVMMVLLCPLVALAEGAVGGPLEPYGWAALGTVAGATALTLLVVQYIKAPLDKVGHIPTRAVVYVIALLILLGAQAFTTGLTWDNVPLVFVNAFVVAFAAMGAYEQTFAKLEARKMEPPDAPDDPA